MSALQNTHRLTDGINTNAPIAVRNDDDGDTVRCNDKDSSTYAVTVSKKPSEAGEETTLCFGQKSFISIHSTDHLCQVADVVNPLNVEECNVEVLSLNDVFPSTSEESLSIEDTSMQRKRNRNKTGIPKCQAKNTASAYVPSNSKSSTISGRPIPVEGAPVYSDFDIPKSTMYVVGSNPGEPKMSYADPPKKISKTMKKFLRNIDKHQNDQNSRMNEKEMSKLTIRSILKDAGCVPECTGDTTVQGAEEISSKALTLPFSMDYTTYTNYSKQSPNVKFNTQVVIIHFKGDLCVGQSVEALSNEKDQQIRNSELRKTFISKYNEFWPTRK